MASRAGVARSWTAASRSRGGRELGGGGRSRGGGGLEQQPVQAPRRGVLRIVGVVRGGVQAS